MSGAAIIERRRPAFSGDMVVRASLAFVLVAVLLIATGFPFIRDQLFPGPDDALRLVQVRDLLAGQSWFDLTQHRVDAPGGGVPMHWSRLVDIPLLLVIAALTPLFGSGVAESIALVVVPLLTLYCALLLAARIAWRLFGIELVTLTCLAMALSVPVLSQLRPMRIDHHGWQIVLALAALNGLLARKPKVGGFVTGLALAAWLAISVEGLPMAIAFMAVFAVRWLCNRRDAEGFAVAMVTLALGSLALFVTTRGWSELAAHCDAISPWHIGVFCWGALGALVLQRLEPMPRVTLMAGFGVLAAGGAAMLFWAAPQCAAGGFAATDPLVAEVWLANVAEGQPLWTRSWSDIVGVALPGLLGLFAASRLASRHTAWLGRFWFEYAALLACALAVALFVSRAGAVAGALAAPPLAWQIDQWLRAARNSRREKRGSPALAVVAATVLVPVGVGLLVNGYRAEAGSPPPAQTLQLQRVSDCRIASAGETLSQLPRGEIFAPLDAGPSLLLASPHGVVATGHHRADRTIRMTIEVLAGSPEHARAQLSERGTFYVAHCPGLAETAMLAAQQPDSFAASLESGNAPDWLEPVDMPGETGLKVWTIKPGA